MEVAIPMVVDHRIHIAPKLSPWWDSTSSSAQSILHAVVPWSTNIDIGNVKKRRNPSIDVSFHDVC